MPRIVLGCVVAWLAATGLPEAAGGAAGLADLPHATEDFPNLEAIDAVRPGAESAPVSPSGFETSRVEQAPKQPAPPRRLRVQRVRELQATPPTLDLVYPVVVTARERKL